MRHRFGLLVWLAVALLPAGCGDSEKTKQLEADLARSRQDAAEQERQLVELQGTHQKSLADLQAATDERDALAKQIESLKADATVMQAQLDKAAADVQTMLGLKEHAEKLAGDYEKVKTDLAAAAGKLQEQASQIASLNELVQTLRGTITDLEARVKGVMAPPSVPGAGG